MKANRQQLHVAVGETCQICLGEHGKCLPPPKETVVQRNSGEHFDQECYVVTSKQPTHAVVWVMFSCEGGSNPYVHEKNGFQDRAGDWWLVGCDLYHTNDRADAYWRTMRNEAFGAKKLTLVEL